MTSRPQRDINNMAAWRHGLTTVEEVAAAALKGVRGAAKAVGLARRSTLLSDDDDAVW